MHSSNTSSRPNTDTDSEEDGDVDMDTGRDDGPSPSPKRQHGDTGMIRAIHSHRAVDVVSDAAAPAIVGPPGIDMPSDGRMIIHDNGVISTLNLEGRCDVTRKGRPAVWFFGGRTTGIRDFPT